MMASREEIKKRIETMQAWLGGKDVQTLASTGAWMTFNISDGGAEFDFDGNKYRIKPQPKEIWLCEGAAGFFSEEEAADHEQQGGKCDLYRQVLDE